MRFSNYTSTILSLSQHSVKHQRVEQKLGSNFPQAALIWLLEAVERTAEWHPASKARLAQLQSAFIEGLTEGSGKTYKGGRFVETARKPSDSIYHHSYQPK